MAKRAKPRFAEEVFIDAVKDGRIPELVPLTYHVVVKPKPPKEQIGSLFTSKRTQNAQLAVCTLGEILSIGPLAWKARLDGLDYSTDARASQLKVGDLVLFKSHAGQKIRYGDVIEDLTAGVERFLLVMADNDIMCWVPTANDYNSFFDWVG